MGIDELLGLVLLIAGGVEVRGLGGKLGSAGIDRLENRTKIIRPTQFADRVFAFVAQVAQVCDLKVGKTCQLRLL